MAAESGDSGDRKGERQLALFAEADDRVVSELRRVDVERMTPLDALQFLADLKKRLD